MRTDNQDFADHVHSLVAELGIATELSLELSTNILRYIRFGIPNYFKGYKAVDKIALTVVFDQSDRQFVQVRINGNFAFVTNAGRKVLFPETPEHLEIIAKVNAARMAYYDTFRAAGDEWDNTKGVPKTTKAYGRREAFLREHPLIIAAAAELKAIRDLSLSICRYTQTRLGEYVEGFYRSPDANGEYCDFTRAVRHYHLNLFDASPHERNRINREKMMVKWLEILDRDPERKEQWLREQRARGRNV